MHYILGYFFTDLCLWLRKNQLNFGDDPDFDPDPLHNHCSGGGLQFLIDLQITE